MAYSTSNPPVLKTQTLPGTNSTRDWYYRSTDAIATVNTAGYITNGYQLGMQVGDNVEVYDSATPTKTYCTVMSVNSTTGAVDLADGTSISVTNSD
jgi:hypothetical protein